MFPPLEKPHRQNMFHHPKENHNLVARTDLLYAKRGSSVTGAKWYGWPRKLTVNTRGKLVYMTLVNYGAACCPRFRCLYNMPYP